MFGKYYFQDLIKKLNSCKNFKNIFFSFSLLITLNLKILLSFCFNNFFLFLYLVYFFIWSHFSDILGLQLI